MTAVCLDGLDTESHGIDAMAIPVDPLDLLEIARSQVDERMTEEECRHYLRRPCDS